jgi:hypothetical protein
MSLIYLHNCASKFKVFFSQSFLNRAQFNFLSLIFLAQLGINDLNLSQFLIRQLNLLSLVLILGLQLGNPLDMSAYFSLCKFKFLLQHAVFNFNFGSLV